MPGYMARLEVSLCRQDNAVVPLGMEEDPFRDFRNSLIVSISIQRNKYLDRSIVIRKFEIVEIEEFFRILQR